MEQVESKPGRVLKHITKEEVEKILREGISKPQSITNNPYTLTMQIVLKGLNCTLEQWDEYMHGTKGAFEEAEELILEMLPKLIAEQNN